MWLARRKGRLWLASLIYSDEQGDVIGQNNELVVQDKTTAVIGAQPNCPRWT